MRATPPKLSLSEFKVPENGVEGEDIHDRVVPDAVSVEAEHFSNRTDHDGFGWRVISGLGKTGDSVSVFPNTAKTFTDFTSTSPSLDYRVGVRREGEFDLDFYLVPTQPLVPGGGLRFAFSIDGGQPQIVAADKDSDVSSAKWSLNILNETTVSTSKIHMERGEHILRLFAVDTGVVVDKIVLHGYLPPSYFGLPETSDH